MCFNNIMPEQIIPPVPTVIPTVAQPTAQTVYSAQNIAQAATAPVTTGNAELDLYNQYMNSGDVQQAKSAVSQLQQQINQRNQALRATTTGLQYQNANALGTTGASMNLIGNQVGRATDLASNELQALAEQQGVAQANLQSILADKQNQYSIIKEERNKVQNLVTQTGGKAGISLTDNYESALKKATSYLEKKEKETKEEAKKDAEKEGLKSLYREYTGSEPKKMSINELRKKVEKLAKENKSKKNALEELDKKLKEKELAKPYYKPDGGTSSDDAKLVKSFEDDIQRLQTAMDKENGSIDWNYAWNYINSKYPGFMPDEIDEALGLNYRAKFEAR